VRLHFAWNKEGEHHNGISRAGSWGAFMDILETQLKHVGYELDMLVYTFDKLLLVEPLVRRSFQAGQVNALIEAFCIHARNLHEFFQGSRADTLKANTFAVNNFKPRPIDQERKTLIAKINRQISHLRAAHLRGRRENRFSGPGEGLLNPDR